MDCTTRGCVYGQSRSESSVIFLTPYSFALFDPTSPRPATVIYKIKKIEFEQNKLLLSHGAERDTKNFNGNTPMEITTNDDMIALLQTFSGEPVKRIAPEVRQGTSESTSINTSRPNSVSSILSGRSLKNSPTFSSPTFGGTRPASSLSVRSITSVRSAESILTTRSSPVRGTRTTRKPIGATPKHAGRAPGIRLSVEYSEETEVLKVRVWSLQSLVMTPDLSNTPNLSIHVRSAGWQGAKIWSKTEDNTVEKYLPNKVTLLSSSENELSEKNIEIAVCVKVPSRVSSKVIYLAKLFLKCEEAVNVVMPKWFLMTSCSIEKKNAKLPTGGTMYKNQTAEKKDQGSWDPPSSLKSPSLTSAASVSHVRITEPISTKPPPKGSGKKEGLRNPFKRDQKVNMARAIEMSRVKSDIRVDLGDSDEPEYKSQGNRLEFSTTVRSVYDMV
eukprot:sb/3479396/